METRKLLASSIFLLRNILWKRAIYNLDVEEGNVDVVVPVCPCMFMIETQGVHDLVGHRSFVLYTQKKIPSKIKSDNVAGVNKEKK
jgi:hypothetical protein